MLGEKRKPEKSGEAKNSGNSAVERDYHKYKMTGQDITITLMQALVLSVAIGWLFYQSLYGICVVALVGPFWYNSKKRKKILEQQQRLRNEFKECIRVVTASLYAGYSVENAFGEAEKELVQLFGEQAALCGELRAMNQQIKLNVPIEVLLQRLAIRSGVEEILGFGQVFGYAKRNGSDFPRILKDTAQRIGEKIQLEREIQTMIASKKMEQQIMNVIPLGILLFINITSPDFLELMYTSLFGRCAMTLCLMVYAGAYLLSGKLVDIKI